MVHVVEGKGKKDRIVPFGPPAAKAIQAMLQIPTHPNKGALFLNKFGNRLSTQKLFGKYAMNLGKQMVYTVYTPMPFDIPVPHIYSMLEPIYVASKNNSVTVHYRPRNDIPKSIPQPYWNHTEKHIPRIERPTDDE